MRLDFSGISIEAQSTIPAASPTQPETCHCQNTLATGAHTPDSVSVGIPQMARRRAVTSDSKIGTFSPFETVCCGGHACKSKSTKAKTSGRGSDKAKGIKGYLESHGPAC